MIWKISEGWVSVYQSLTVTRYFKRFLKKVQTGLVNQCCYSKALFDKNAVLDMVSFKLFATKIEFSNLARIFFHRNRKFGIPMPIGKVIIYGKMFCNLRFSHIVIMHIGWIIIICWQLDIPRVGTVVIWFLRIVIFHSDLNTKKSFFVVFKCFDLVNGGQNWLKLVNFMVFEGKPRFARFFRSFRQKKFKRTNIMKSNTVSFRVYIAI